MTITKILCVTMCVSCISISAAAAQDASSAAVASLKSFLATSPERRAELSEQNFAATPLTRDDVVLARRLLGDDALTQIRHSRAAEWKLRVLESGENRMPFAYHVFGDKPAGGRSLYISLHGGGGTPKSINDQQWENQKRLYQPAEGIYVAPRAPTDTWNLWHQSHIDELLVQLIENMVAFEEVNWDRVYILGYSAGGDGVYQLAPRMSDRWAAAAMMAGHPNETSPLGLRNVPFALQVGGKDSAYDRNKIAAQWEVKLAELQRSDPGGYEHFVKIYPNKAHWMDREDVVAIPWMAKHTRNATPEKIVWCQDDVTHTQYYWLGVEQSDAKGGTLIVAEVRGQNIELTTKDLRAVTVFLDDRFIDLDHEISIESSGEVLFQGRVDRTIADLCETLQQRGDPGLSFPSSVNVKFSQR